jgi:hypothetical protein
MIRSSDDANQQDDPDECNHGQRRVGQLQRQWRARLAGRVRSMMVKGWTRLS